MPVLSVSVSKPSEEPVGPAIVSSAAKSKKRPRIEAEPAKAGARRTNICVCTAKNLQGNIALEYAEGKARCIRNVAHLTFTTSVESSPKMQRFIMSTGTFLKNAAALKDDSEVHSTWGRDTFKGGDQVTSVLVNVNLTLPPDESKILMGIREACLDYFPNLRPESFVVHVHRGYEHWQVDDLFVGE